MKIFGEKGEWARKFFDSTVELRLHLHYLLPPPHDSELLLCSGAPLKFQGIQNRTIKYQPFASYAVRLSKYQTS